MRLPSTIPLFPLPGVVLFPRVPLPLHIFEPRYRQMVKDVTASHEIVGMILLRGDGQASPDGQPEIFEVGCAGRVSSVESLPDGRFNILLHGVREFTVRQQLFDQPYRQAVVEWRPPVDEGLAPDLRESVVTTLKRYLPPESAEAAHRMLQDPDLSDEALVNSFSFALDLEPIEKQGLLQAGSLGERARQLVETVEFHLEARRFPGSRRNDGAAH